MTHFGVSEVNEPWHKYDITTCQEMKVGALCGCALVGGGGGFDVFNLGGSWAVAREAEECQKCRHVYDCVVGRGLCHVRKDGPREPTGTPGTSQG